MAAPVLDITTLAHRETVRINGTAYELKNSAELAIFDLARLQRTAARVHEIDQMVAPTSTDRAEYDDLVDRAVRLILAAPDTVHDTLSLAHREAILWTFIGLSRPSLGLMRATTAETASGTRRKTAGRSARGSRASTAARRRSGS